MTVDRNAKPGGYCALGFQHKVVAIDKACKRTLKAEAVFSGWRERKLIADIREYHEAFQLMIPVCTFAFDVKSQVDLGPRCLTDETGGGAVMGRAAQTTG